MTHGTLAGMLIADLIRGRPNPWLALYDPERRTTRATGDYLREDANFVARMIEKWVAPSDVANAEAVRPGQAAVLRQGASKIAVYRDEGGRLHRRSAVCTHLGCIVQWNPGEKSWDCPCHGSRFDPDGRVLNGPAVAPLKPADPDDKGDRT
jgi:Rieske Fe-S protein